MKELVKSILGSELFLRVGLARQSGRTMVLAWHNVVAPSAPAFGDRSLHLDFDRFRRQLDALPKSLRIVAVPDVLSESTNDEPRCVFTFDDAYAGALKLALPELSSRGYPATMFVAPGLLDGPSPWWDAYADPDAGLLPEFRDHALTACGGDSQRVDVYAREAGIRRREGGDAHRIGTLAELTAASKLPHVTLGAHSWTHPNFAMLSETEFARELERPLAWLRSTFPEQTIPWLAWPYGAFSSVAERAAAASYNGVFLVAGGWTKAVVNPAHFPRLNVPAGMKPTALRAHIGGWLSA